MSPPSERKTSSSSGASPSSSESQSKSKSKSKSCSKGSGKSDGVHLLKGITLTDFKRLDEPFVPRNVNVQTFIPFGELSPETTSSLVFADSEGRSLCWRMGMETADEFVKKNGLQQAEDRIFYTNRIRVFYPITKPQIPGGPNHEDSTYFAMRIVNVPGTKPPTLSRLLRQLEISARHSVAAHMMVDLHHASVTLRQVIEHMRHAVCCHLALKRVGGANHVYVRLA
jgi:hypothetical protein